MRRLYQTNQQQIHHGFHWNSEEYSSREFLRTVTYSFDVTNDKYFDEWAAEEWETLENGTDPDDSENEAVTAGEHCDMWHLHG